MASIPMAARPPQLVLVGNEPKPALVSTVRQMGWILVLWTLTTGPARVRVRREVKKSRLGVRCIFKDRDFAYNQYTQFVRALQ